MSQVKRSIFTFGSGIAQTAGTMVFGLVSIPLLLRWLGEEKYGALRAANDWMAYLALLELGLGGALLPLLIRAVGRSDREALRRTMALGFRGYVSYVGRLVIGGLLLATVITWLIPVAQNQRWDLRFGVVVLTIGSVTVPLLLFRLLLEASQRGYVVNLALLLQSLVVNTLFLLFAWRGWGITGQCWATVLGILVFYIPVLYAVTKLYNGISRGLWLQKKDVEMARELRGLSWPTLILQTSSQVGLLTDNIIIAGLMGPSLVVPFAITQRLIAIAAGQLKGIGAATWAPLATLYMTGNHVVFRQRLLELIKITATIGFAVLAPLAAYNHFFIGLWVGTSRFGGEALTIIACINALLLALLNLFDLALGTTGYISNRIPVAIVSGVTNLLGSLIFTYCFHITGPVLGTLFATILVNIWWYPILLNSAFQISPTAIAIALTKPILVGIPYSTALWWWAHVHRPMGWVGLTVEMSASAIVFLGIAWFVIISKEEQMFWRTRLTFFRR